MSALDDLNWSDVRRQYDVRETIHQKLLGLLQNERIAPFVSLLLGISNPAGNYSADEHKLGPQILNGNVGAEIKVVELARQFMVLEQGNSVPEIIRHAAILHLKIGVGSEASCMLNPTVCWVANTRTIWTHLVIKHDGNFSKADEELSLYRDKEERSEMAYRKWAAIHRELADSMTRIAEEGEKLASQASVIPGAITYLWADAIANALYESSYE